MKNLETIIFCARMKSFETFCESMTIKNFINELLREYIIKVKLENIYWNIYD